MLVRACLLGVVWRGQLGPWQGMCLQIGAPLRALLILGVMAPVKRDLPFAMCCLLCVLPSQAGHRRAHGDSPAAGASGSPGRHSGRGQPRSPVPEEGGTRTPLLCRLLWPAALSHHEVCSGFRGRGRRGVPWFSSPSPQKSGQLRAWGALLRPQRFLHPSEGPPPSRGKSPHHPWAR